MKTIFITIIMMLLPILASAEPVEVDGLNYLLNEEKRLLQSLQAIMKVYW